MYTCNSDSTINVAKIPDIKFILGLNHKQHMSTLLFVYASNVGFWRYISDIAVVRKHVVTLTFPNLGTMML